MLFGKILSILKIVCVGRNYAAHIEELENERPNHPVLFIKPDTSILQKKAAFFYSPLY